MPSQLSKFYYIHIDMRKLLIIVYCMVLHSIFTYEPIYMLHICYHLCVRLIFALFGRPPFQMVISMQALIAFVGHTILVSGNYSCSCVIDC